MENNKIEIVENGVSHTYRVLLNIEDVDGKNYCVYTEDEEKKGDIIAYAAEYEMVNGKPKFKSIKDDKTWEFVKDLLNSIQNIEE